MANITYDSIKHRLEKPLDCTNILDLRGEYFSHRVILNFTNTDFSGCVLMNCYPRVFRGAIEVNPATSEESVGLVGAELDDAELEYAELSGARLDRVSLKRAKLKKANLPNASLRGANLENADLTRAYLDNADLTWGTLKGSTLIFTRLTNATLRNTNLQQVSAGYADFSGSCLMGSVLRWSDFENVKFRNADLRNVNFSGCSLRGVDFGGADLRNANFRGAVVDRRTNMYKAIYNADTILPNNMERRHLRTLTREEDVK